VGRFEEIARRRGVGTIERCCVEEDTDIGLCMQSRYSDLVVVSQASLKTWPAELRSDLPQDVVLHSARPVLILPSTCTGISTASSITIAWNGSNEAARAIYSALPLLQRARQVDLVVFDAELERDAHGELPGADMADYLAHHGVRVEVSSLRAGRYECDALIAFATEHGADLIVMGAYGHSRFRQLMLGGVTSSMLAISPLPLWMCH
jgi:nucleotide-binding universal stress UspA family protein